MTEYNLTYINMNLKTNQLLLSILHPATIPWETAEPSEPYGKGGVITLRATEIIKIAVILFVRLKYVILLHRLLKIDVYCAREHEARMKAA
jgi:hypothetical protein